jgi:hypothetical protein
MMDSIEETISSTNKTVKAFNEKYELEVEIDKSCIGSVENAILAGNKVGLPIIITMDEYDRLARSSRDGKEAEIDLMKSLFTVFKTRPPRYHFVTDIMPLLATELSSATNDVEVVTHDLELADAIGLPEEEVFRELQRIAKYHGLAASA